MQQRALILVLKQQYYTNAELKIVVANAYATKAGQVLVVTYVLYVHSIDNLW